MTTAGDEMGKALKGLIRTTHHSTAVVAERRSMEQNKNVARDTFARARVSPHPLQKPSPAPLPRSIIHGQFRDRSDNSVENKLRSTGIADRYDGVQTLKEWQSAEIEAIDRKTRELVDQLYADRDAQLEQDKVDWSAHKEKHDLIRDEAHKELGVTVPKAQVPEKTEPQQQPEPDISYDRYGNEVIDMSGAVEPEVPPYEPPPLEPDGLVPAHYHDIDFEIGD